MTMGQIACMSGSSIILKYWALIVSTSWNLHFAISLRGGILSGADLCIHLINAFATTRHWTMVMARN